MNEHIKETIRFVLEDDNEGMRAALDSDSDLDSQNKQLNRELIRRHEQILVKLDRGEALGYEDLELVRDANEIHVNDTLDLGSHHEVAVALECWLAAQLVCGPAFDEGGRCLKCGSQVSFADVTDTVVFVGNEVFKRYDGDITNRNCVRCNAPRQYPEWAHYDDENDPSLGANGGGCGSRPPIRRN